MPTKSSNPAHGEVYSIQHYVIKFVNDLQQDLRSVVFYAGIPVSSTNKTDCHDITEILLKVASNSINHKPKPQFHRCASWQSYFMSDQPRKKVTSTIVVHIVVSIQMYELFQTNICSHFRKSKIVLAMVVILELHPRPLRNGGKCLTFETTSITFENK